jgi:hypothetical protein
MSATNIDAIACAIPGAVAVAPSVAGFEALARASIEGLRHKVRHKFSSEFSLPQPPVERYSAGRAPALQAAEKSPSPLSLPFIFRFLTITWGICFSLES